MECFRQTRPLIYFGLIIRSWHGPNVSTTPITAMGCRKCLPLSVVQLKGKHCRKPHYRNGVVDTFRQWLLQNLIQVYKELNPYLFAQSLPKNYFNVLDYSGFKVSTVMLRDTSESSDKRLSIFQPMLRPQAIHIGAKSCIKLEWDAGIWMR